MQAAAPQRTRAALPLIAICCLGLILFLIAATIVLALIPVYLSSRAQTPATPSNNPFYLQYSAPATADTGISGTITNLNDVGTGINVPSDVQLMSGFTQNTILRRRKRGLNSRRQKRDLVLNILIICQFKTVKTCNGQCLARRTQILTNIKKVTVISSVNIAILSGGRIRTVNYRLTFLGLVQIRPVGFLGAASSLTFVAVRSGAFNDPLTWSEGIMPYDTCNIVIPAGITVTHARPTMDIRVQTATVYGTFAVGAGSSTFTWLYPIALNVLSGGICQDDTSSKRMLIPQGSIVTVYPGGGFAAAGTMIQSYTSGGGVGGSFTVTSASGPFTCASLPSGMFLSYNRLTFIAIQSGGFTSGSTFFGGIAPSVDVCALYGCDVYVAPGAALSTSDLNGVLSVRVDMLTIPTGATFQLGTPGSTTGFKILNPFQLFASGTVAFVMSGPFFVPPGCSFNLFAGIIFTSVNTYLQSFDVVTGDLLGPPAPLPTFSDGPAFVIVTITGLVIMSPTPGPGTTTSIPVTSSMG